MVKYVRVIDSHEITIRIGEYAGASQIKLNIELDIPGIETICFKCVQLIIYVLISQIVV